jgi:hypothetical protein
MVDLPRLQMSGGFYKSPDKVSANNSSGHKHDRRSSSGLNIVNAMEAIQRMNNNNLNGMS